MGEKTFKLPPAAQEIVDGLKDAVDIHLIMVRDEHDKSSVWIYGDWLFRDPEGPDEKVPKRGCHLEATINDRWMLSVWTSTESPPNPSAHSLVKWAAQKLSPHLPRRPVDDLPYPPAGGSGGPPGSAEIGIPVWWARRTRN